MPSRNTKMPSKYRTAFYDDFNAECTIATAMLNHENGEFAPWYMQKPRVRKVKVENMYINT